MRHAIDQSELGDKDTAPISSLRSLAALTSICGSWKRTSAEQVKNRDAQGMSEISSGSSLASHRRPLTSHECLHIQLSMSEETKRVERECVGFRVRKLNRMVTAIYDGALASAGLKTSQFTVLVAVSNREKVRPSELTKLLQMDESTLSRNVERMCARGWLRLEQNEDRRSHLIEVTDKGQALIRKCLPAWQRAQEEVSQRLGADSVAALRSALRKLHA
ncbi:MAG TPA: MarR family winged helix-turn-helix transcriptional regulator [Candidatus Binataceae bacterium]